MTLPAAYIPIHSAMSSPYAWGVLSKYTSDHVISLPISDATQTPEHSIQGLGTTIWFGFTQNPFPSLFCKHILTHHRLRWQVTQVEVIICPHQLVTVIGDQEDHMTQTRPIRVPWDLFFYIYFNYSFYFKSLDWR